VRSDTDGDVLKIPVLASRNPLAGDPNALPALARTNENLPGFWVSLAEFFADLLRVFGVEVIERTPDGREGLELPFQRSPFPFGTARLAKRVV